jgi:predicted small lipoprotein YifL
MKNLFFVVMALAAIFALSGCESIGKGKAPVPVITNG